MTRVYLSLGSNLEPHRHLRAALGALHRRFGAITKSPVYCFPAIGFDGPDFLNLAVGLDTDVDAETLNAWLHGLEDEQGRRRDVPRFSSRTLDIDIVLYGDLVLKGKDHLDIPRPELDQAFVLKPLADIAPRALHPLLGKTIFDLWREHPAYSQPFEHVLLQR
ncbi:MAG TPA: 2-amino-4-hydroxy-6-hydroxymethyldihydropteridine diphosphokinase [Rudaea sp.]|jgi:2-amino-4-hydroxy-6-hydroxymethyldihydropteridine diphosphokinase